MAGSDQKSDQMGNVIGAAAGGVAGSDTKPQVPYTDLREWIAEARKLGEIREVKGLSWEKDIGMASEVILHDENAPCVIFTDVPGRVAKQLLLLAQRFGTREGEAMRVTHDLTQEEIAQLVGASRETVNKALADFAHRGWIRLEGKSVLISDSERMARRAR